MRSGKPKNMLYTRPPKMVGIDGLTDRFHLSYNPVMLLINTLSTLHERYKIAEYKHCLRRVTTKQQEKKNNFILKFL